MARLTDDIGSFKTGDIIITQRIESARVYHTTLFLKAAHSPLTKISLAHAGDQTEVVETSAYDKVVPPPHRHFSCPNANLGIAVATEAVRWSDRRTSYGSYPSSQNAAVGGGTNANRYSGMVTTASLNDIPFELNALVRLLKWVEKSNKNEPFSVNRGTTCCAFISACYQTAFMKKYLELNYVSAETVAKANKQIAKEMETKAAVRKRTGLAELVTTADRGSVSKGTKLGYVGQALRANSNRQTLASSPLHGKNLDEQWEHIQTNLLNIADWTGSKYSLTKIIPTPFFYDIKYMNTKLLETSLINNNWKYKDYDQY